ncbi:MAG: hypothetical protein IJS75_07265 [Bacteroidales bacterium]|nr:hypothetical protein [Bacteroidales bacterium]MBQ8461387.1 hypothetical protein [Bacteroidales bacterium]MCR5364144.1 hypothetical protein [Bacteroidales bacterium]
MMLNYIRDTMLLKGIKTILLVVTFLTFVHPVHSQVELRRNGSPDVFLDYNYDGTIIGERIVDGYFESLSNDNEGILEMIILGKANEKLVVDIFKMDAYLGRYRVSIQRLRTRLKAFYIGIEGALIIYEHPSPDANKVLILQEEVAESSQKKQSIHLDYEADVIDWYNDWLLVSCIISGRQIKGWIPWVMYNGIPY